MKRISIISAVLSLSCAVCPVFAQDQSQDADMANVKAIMQHSHQVQQQHRDTVQQNQAEQKAASNFMGSLLNNANKTGHQQLISQGTSASNASIAVSATPAGAAATPGTVKDLETQVSQLNQANLSYQQQTNQQIDVLKQSQTILQSKLANLGQVLSILNQEVNQLSHQIQTAQKQLVSPNTPQQAMPVSSSFTQELMHGTTMQYILYAILALLVIVILLLIPRRGGYRLESVAPSSNPGGAANDIPETTDTKDEYDFMGTKEAIPAKLDLARAYLAMEDYKSANKVLTQVLKAGNGAQKKEAKEMLDRIPK